MSVGFRPVPSADDGMAKAAADQDVAKIHYFRTQGANPDGVDATGISLLQHAANNGRMQAAAALIEAGASLNQNNGPSHWTALHYAAYRNNAAMAQLLLDAKADPNVATPDGERPLHTAAHAGDLDVIKALVKAGADIFAKDARNHTAMDIATIRAAERLQFAQRPFTDIAEYLKQEMDAAAQRAEAARLQKETVAHDLAALKARHPERFRLKPR